MNADTYQCIQGLLNIQVHDSEDYHIHADFDWHFDDLSYMHGEDFSELVYVWCGSKSLGRAYIYLDTSMEAELDLPTDECLYIIIDNQMVYLCDIKEKTYADITQTNEEE